MQAIHRHRFTLPLPPSKAFPLFTAEGERRWVPGWDPTFHHADTEETTSEGTVWETRDGEDRVLWMCVDFDAPRSVRYARVSPERFDLVTISCTPHAGGTSVEVSYRFTPLTERAHADVAAIDEAGFARKIAAWPDLIAAAAAAA